MSNFSNAVNLICKHAGYNEKAYADPSTGAEPYSFGYGTQFYPDGSPVKREQCCSKEKALEYLFYELNIIDDLLSKLELEQSFTAADAAGTLVKRILVRKFGEKPGFGGYIVNVDVNGKIEYHQVTEEKIEALSPEKLNKYVSANQGSLNIYPDELF
jgi:hypothetical protein